MGYEVCLTTSEGEVLTSDVPGNITFNVAPMLNAALGFPFTQLNGQVAGEKLDDIERAIRRMRQAPTKYKGFEPSNKWGSFEGTLGYLRRLRTVARKHPEARIRISG